MTDYYAMIDMGQGGETRFRAQNDEAAWEHAVQWAEGGDWSDFGSDSVTLTLEQGGRTVRHEGIYIR